jgi:hypothetical protein
MGTLSQILNSGIQATSSNDGTTLRDYQHASKIFRVNNSSFLPKAKNWFHIFFEIEPSILSFVTSSLNTATTTNRINWNPSNVPILGILAKTVKLPSFKFDVKKNNQYNRWNLTTTKINYDPIEISFWDDTVDVIRGFWYAYYQFMIQDPKYVDFQMAQTQGINIPYQWVPSTNNLEMLYSTSSNWQGGNYGLDTVNSMGSTLNKVGPFFRSVRIYQFNRQTDSNYGPQYTEYVLVNPIISSFDHDTVDFSSSEFMQNRMSIEYETVLYNSGTLNNNEIASWDAVTQTFFDTTPSPIAGTNLLLNQTNQLGNVFSNTIQEIISAEQGGLNINQNSTLTTLNQVIGTSAQVLAAASAITNGQISVPTVINNFGISGLPPTI